MCIFVTSGQLFVFCAEMKIAVPLDVDNKPEALHLEYYFSRDIIPWCEAGEIRISIHFWKYLFSN